MDGKPGVLQSVGPKEVGQDWHWTELRHLNIWLEMKHFFLPSVIYKSDCMAKLKLKGRNTLCPQWDPAKGMDDVGWKLEANHLITYIKNFAKVKELHNVSVRKL